VARAFVIMLQVVVSALLTPLALNQGLLSAINMITPDNVNLRYQLHFVVSHFGTYVVAALAALIFWIVGRVVSRVLWSPRVPSFATLVATLVLALGFAHLSQMAFVGELNNLVYATFYRAVPPIAFPLIGAVLAALLVPGKRAA
jgi:hypothetical protein